MIKNILIILLVVATGSVYGVAKAMSGSDVGSEFSVPIVIEDRREVRLVIVPTVVNQAEEFILNTKEADISVPDEPEVKVEELIEIVVEESVLVEMEVEDNSDEVYLELDTTVFEVPFYSQFTDITAVSWQKVSCGIAGVAMLIDFYSDEAVSADALLEQGIAAGSFLSDAGWIHSGLIQLSHRYGLDGASHSLAHLGMAAAFSELETVVDAGPVMVSVHYTFEPTNPIPHLVVINGVRDGQVFYNDPAEVSGGGSLSIEKFKNAWKKRYISIRPV